MDELLRSSDSNTKASPIETTKHKETTLSQKPKKLFFEDDLTRQPSDEVSQKKRVAVEGGETLPDKHMIDYECTMQSINPNKKVVLIAQNKGHDQLAKDCPFSYGRLLCLDYGDPDSNNLIILTSRLFKGGP